MQKPTPTYERLTRPASSSGSYKSLWLGAGHLLVVSSTGFTEKYERIELMRIKGFFVVPNRRRMLWAVPWAAGALASAAALADAVRSGRSPLVSGTLLGLFALLMLWNHLLGPGCRAYVVTRAQTAPLPSLVRRRAARRVLARLGPVIAGIQVELSAAPHARPPPSRPQ